ncbi:hypothetical protein F5146DRAFT_1143157 [Armillaria mellea]|nr:hypothetical protein F5146DRAFT_1143157 [Armillaria mellea]
MARLTVLLEQLSVVLFLCASFTGARYCRTVPRDPSFPSAEEWNSLNSSVSGRLVKVVPSAQFCDMHGGCTDAEWTSSSFRADIPGAMNYVNWEQDYESIPPSICQRNSTDCGQGNVPLYAILAESIEDVQNITFAENFAASGHNGGSAVTVGSGVPLNTIYQAAKEQGKILVGAGVATIVAAGGYITVLEFEIVTANSNISEVFWALRGGGAGSWGVVVSATFRTFPTFNATTSLVSMVANDTAAIGSIMATHAKHIFDWDDLYMSQFVYANKNTTGDAYMMREVFGQIVGQQFTETSINDGLTKVDDAVGSNLVLGSRLIPASAYRDHPDTFGHVYTQLLDVGTDIVLTSLVAGGKVSENAHIDSAIHPAWRTAKTHFVLINVWDDSASLSNVSSIQSAFKDSQLPILEQIVGSPGAAYSNEGDILEEDFKTTFYGPHYPRLEEIKMRYDPKDMFIVAAGTFDSSELRTTLHFCSKRRRTVSTLHLQIRSKDSGTFEHLAATVVKRFESFTSATVLLDQRHPDDQNVILKLTDRRLGSRSNKDKLDTVPWASSIEEHLRGAIRDIQAGVKPNWCTWMMEMSEHDTELSEYQLLHRLQGRYIPRLYSVVRLHITSESTPLHPIPDAIEGLALEYIPGVRMDKLKPGIDVSEEAEKISSAVLEGFHAIKAEKCLLHSDVYTSNIVLREGNQGPAIVNFGDANLRNPEYSDEEWERVVLFLTTDWEGARDQVDQWRMNPGVLADRGMIVTG